MARRAHITKTLKPLIMSGLIATASAAIAAPDHSIQFEDEQQYGGRFKPEDPTIYDLGLDLAVIFYYDNAQGERVVVTTIGPKDPDSGRPASEHIVTLIEGEHYRARLASDDPSVEPIHFTVRCDRNSTQTPANQ